MIIKISYILKISKRMKKHIKKRHFDNSESTDKVLNFEAASL